MADELTKKKVQQDLEEDKEFYDKQIEQKSANIENLEDEVELQRLQNEKQKREIAEQNIS